MGGRCNVMKLTEKQKRFADYYIEIGNAEESYTKAGYKSARGNAHKLLQNTAVKKYIDERLKQLQSEKIADQQEVLERLTRVLRREEKDYQVVTLKTRRTFTDENGKKQTTEEEKAEVVPIPTRVSDMNKAAELLGKRYGTWTDNINVEGRVQIIDNIPKSDEK